MKEVKDSPRAHVRIGYDGRVHKTYRGRMAEERYHTEKTILRFLERRGCDFVPRMLDCDEDELLLVMSNCGQPVETMTQEKMNSLYDELEGYGVRHADQAARNVTYDARRGRLCVIDFEFAELVDKKPARPSWTKLCWAGKVDKGRFRRQNDDTLAVFTIDQEGFRQLGEEGEASIEDGDLVFVVCDGMGGAAAGDLASEMIVGRLREMIPHTYEQAANNLYPDRLGVLKECLEDAHEAVNRLAEKKSQLAGMGATVTLCWFTPENVYYGHVGDTRLYRLRDGDTEQITEDHSRPWQLMKRGKLNEREYRTHPQKNLIQQAIGAGRKEVEPMIGALSLRKADWFLLCSDGLIGGLWEKHVKGILGQASTPSAITDELLKKSLEDDGRDNISLVTVEVCS